MIRFQKVFLKDVPSSLHRFISISLSVWGGNPHVGYRIVNEDGVGCGYIFKSNAGKREDKVFSVLQKWTVLDLRTMEYKSASSLKEAKEIARLLFDEPEVDGPAP